LRLGPTQPLTRTERAGRVTGLAVIGGRLMATKISQRTVAFTGGMLFLIFSAHSFYTAND
jgi:putative Ca2+/H+ antiporter (TMEM165/GDT1 family)